MLAGLFNGLKWQQYATGGGWGVDRSFTSGRADLHIRARSLLVCVCLHICKGVFHVCECVFTCMYTDNTCVYVHGYVYYVCHHPVEV